MTDQTANQPMAELIKNYIRKRRNDKEIKLLKNKPNKKGVGGINHKLREKLKSCLSKEVVEYLEKKIKEEMSLFGEQKKYEMLVSLADKHELDVKSIIDEYQEQLQISDSEQRVKNICKLLKGRPKKNGAGGINHKLREKLTSGLSEEEVEDLEKKINDVMSLLSEQKRYVMLVSQFEKYSPDVESIIDEYDKLLKKIEDEHDCNAWLSWAAEKADGVSLATHVIKLTHSGISKASCFYDKSTARKNSYLTTSQVHRPVIDGAYDNAALSPIASLLQLKNKNGSLADQILAGNYSGLDSYATDNVQLEDWVAGFRKALDAPQKSSHYLAKQVYFPVADNGYHLLANVTSSSLCHELFERFQKYWEDEEKDIRDHRYNGKYSSKLCVSYPNKAVIKVTASLQAHKNVSQRNQERKGKITLLSCQPPIWKSSLKPPINKGSLFYGEVQYWARDSLKDLQRLLLAIKTKELSVNNPKIHAHLSALVNDIVGSVFHYVSAIQNLENQAGWSKHASKLKLSHQLWLDPFRDEDEFQQQRKSTDWQAELCRDFSLWLNKRLGHKQLTLGKQQEAFWQKVFKPRLREFNAITEVKQ